MQNLKIGTRPGLGFGLIVLLLIAIAIVSVTHLKAVSGRTDTIVNDRYVEAALALKIKSDVGA